MSAISELLINSGDLVIYAPGGVPRMTAHIGKGSKREFKLMEYDRVTLMFTVDTVVELKVGDYIDLAGVGRYELTEPQEPSRDKKSGGYAYQLTMNAQYYKFGNKIMKFMPFIGASETTWNYTGTLGEHALKVLDNIMAMSRFPEEHGRIGEIDPSKTGFLYMGEKDWKIEFADPLHELNLNKCVPITYEKTNIIDAISTIADEFECEWWFDEEVLRFGRCCALDAYGEPDMSCDTLTFGEEVVSVTKPAKRPKKPTRFYAFGSDRNLPSTYRKDLVFVADMATDVGMQKLLMDRTRPLKPEWFAGEGITLVHPENSRHEVPCELVEYNPNGPDYTDWETPHTITILPPASYLPGHGERVIKIKGNRARVEMVNAATWRLNISDIVIKVKRLTDNTNLRHTAVATVKITGSTPWSLTQGGRPDQTLNQVVKVEESFDDNLIHELRFSPEQEYITIPAFQGHIDIDFRVTINVDAPQFEGGEAAHCVAIGLPPYGEALITGGINGTVNVGASKNGTFILEEVYPATRVEGITLQFFDENGDVIEGKNIDNVVYNPNYMGGTMFSQMYFELPYDCELPEFGAKFFPSGLNTAFVPAAYYTDKYAAYAESVNVTAASTVHKKLMLPERTGGYIDAYEGIPYDEIVETAVEFDDVYPGRISHVVNVESEYWEKKQDEQDGSQSTISGVRYRIQDDLFGPERPWAGTYQLEGKDLEITFQDVLRYEEGDEIPDGKRVGDPVYGEIGGQLSGQTFKVTYDTVSHMFEIKPNDNTDMPNAQVMPCVGDTYILSGFNISLISDTDIDYIGRAEERLLETARRYVEKTLRDDTPYECVIGCDVAKAAFEKGVRQYLKLGQIVNLVSDEIPGGERQSRVIGWDVPLDFPYDNPKFVIGEKAQTTRLGAIEAKLDELKATATGFERVMATSMSHIHDNKILLDMMATDSDRYLYIQGQKVRAGISDYSLDSTKWDGKLFMDYLNQSVRREDDVRFLSVEAKDRVDTKALKAGSVETDALFTPGSIEGFNGRGFRLTIDPSGKAWAYTDNLVVRNRMDVQELVIQEVNSVGGAMIISQAADTVGEVDYGDVGERQGGTMTYYTFVALMEGKGNGGFVVGDLARWQAWDYDRLRASSGESYNNRYGWGVVKNVSRSAESHQQILTIEVPYPSSSADVSLLPKEGDAIVQMGHISDESRQNVVEISTMRNAEGVTIYSGIDRPEGGTVRARLGSLEGVNDPDISADGWGLYCDNVFLKGELILRAAGQDLDGRRLDDVLTEFGVTVNGLTSRVSGVASTIESTNLLLDTNQGEVGWLVAGGGQVYNIYHMAIAEIWHTRRDNAAGEAVVFNRLPESLNSEPATWEIMTYQLHPEYIKAGRKYTLSFRVYFEGVPVMTFNCGICDNLGGNYLAYCVQSHLIEGNSDENLVTVTFTTVADGHIGGPQSIYINPEVGRQRWTRMLIWDIKLEEGDMATRWTPSSADAGSARQAATSLIQQTASEIKMEVRDERRGAGIDISQNGVTIDGDKVTVRNGDRTTALFEDGVVNAELIKVRGVEARDNTTVVSSLNMEQDIPGSFVIFWPNGKPRLRMAPMDIRDSEGDSVSTVMQYYNDHGELVWWLDNEGIRAASLPYSWEVAPYEMCDNLPSSEICSRFDSGNYRTLYRFVSNSNAACYLGGTYADYNDMYFWGRDLGDREHPLISRVTNCFLYSRAYELPEITASNGKTRPRCYHRYRYEMDSHGRATVYELYIEFGTNVVWDTKTDTLPWV